MEHDITTAAIPVLSLESTGVNKIYRNIPQAASLTEASGGVNYTGIELLEINME